MDSFIIKATVVELKKLFSHTRIRKIGQINPTTLWLQIKKDIENWIIIRCADPNPGLYSCTEKPKQNLIQTPFALALSNALTGGEITDISVERLERVVYFRILQRKAGYIIQKLDLVIELIDHHSFLLLKEADSDKILASSKIFQGKGREVQPGKKYKPLHCSTKHNPFEIKKIEWMRLLSNWPLQEDLCAYLTQNLFGLSPIIIEELLFRGGVRYGKSYPKTLPIKDLWNSLHEILREYDTCVFHPYVMISPYMDRPPILSSFPLESKVGYGEWVSFSTMNKAADFYFEHLDKFWSFIQLRAKLNSIIKISIEKNKKRLSHIEEDIRKFKAQERSKDYGDILMASLNHLKKGMKSIILQDFFRGGEILIPLDPAKDPVQNAQEYYKRHGKIKRGRDIVNKRKKETSLMFDKLSRFDKLLHETKEINDLEEIEKAIGKLTQKEKGRERGKFLTEKNLINAPKGVRIFIINDIWTILVGKTDKDNDYLIRELSKPEDIWFHVLDAPGSHVILKNPQRLEDIPLEILKKAASIAAFFSRQRNEKKTPVSYTKKKYIRKPKGMKPGQVLVERVKTLFVNPSVEGEKFN